MKNFTKLLTLFLVFIGYNTYAQCTANFNQSQPNCPDVSFVNLSLADGLNTITSNAWDFGDGSPIDSTQSPTHTYSTNGAYAAQLIIETSSGCRDTLVDSVFITCIPTCDAGFTVDSSACPTVDFTDTTIASETIVSWNWDFGDGNTSTVQNPSNTYAANGSYTVQLIMNTLNGCSDTATKDITVSCIVPGVCEADFGVDSSSCPTLAFADSSTSNGSVNSWNWDFGDGQTSTAQNPSNTYAANGSYVVTLIMGTDNNCGDTISKTISVSCIPEPCTAGFSIDSSACPDVTFTDTSSSNDGPIVGWSWDFGDGQTSLLQSPTNTYAANGVYDVRLAINTLNGCVDTAITTITVSCIVPPTCNAAFDIDSSACPTVNFTDTSTASSTILTWNWDFGDGNTATTQNATNTYAANGNYDVQLIITDLNGCSDTTITPITVSCIPPPACEAGFSVDSSACPSVAFTDTSSTNGTITAWSWDFGDGNTSTAQNPTNNYAQNGTYDVKLVIDTDNGCSDSVITTITISCVQEPCVADFGVDSTNCPTLAFADSSVSNSSTIISWAWDFGDGQTSPLQNPSNTYAANGTYTVQLIITALDGCADTTTQDITVSCIPPPFCDPGFTADTTACPDVAFTDTSNASGTITSWAWDFGDGATDTVQNPNHTYAANGSYIVCLSIMTDDTCSNTICDTVIVDCYPPPSCDALFAFDTTNCPTVDFTDLSTGTDTAISWSWDFGDLGASTQQNPSYTYLANGQYTVCLTVVNADSCTSTFCDTVTVSCIAGPVCNADFDAITDNCPDIAFINKSSASGNIASYSWDFGDGSGSNGANPIHTYSANGTYNVCLTIQTDDNCTSTFCDSVEVTCYPPPTCSPNFNITVANCADYAFINSSTTTSGNIIAYSWDLGDGTTSTQQSPTHTYAANGSYRVCLTIATDDGCVETRCKTINITCLPPPECEAGFRFNTAGCPTVAFLDTSRSNEPVASWFWQFGDGGTDNVQNPVYTYSAQGTYTVSLKVITSDTCISDFSTTVTITCVGLEEGLEHAEISLYPNPATDVINVDLGEQFDAVSVQLIQLNGQVVRSLDVENTDQFEIDLSGIESGIYMVTMLHETGYISRKIVVGN